MGVAVEQTERGQTIINALRLLAHTQRLEPDYLQSCIEAAGKGSTPGFGSLHEQDAREFGPLLEHVRGARSVLEIGSRYGESVKYFASVAAPGACVVSVDLPYAGGDIGNQPDPEPILREVIRKIAGAGYRAHLIIGDSHDQKVVEMVQAHAPYDFLFIDGDHSYAGVKADWENYGPMAKTVAFHDIVNNADCMRLWAEAKKNYRHVEYTASGWLGIGVLFKD